MHVWQIQVNEEYMIKQAKNPEICSLLGEEEEEDLDTVNLNKK